MVTCMSSYNIKILLIKKFEIKMFTSDWFFSAERRGWVAQQSVAGVNSVSMKQYILCISIRVSGLLLMAFKIFVVSVHIYYRAHHTALKMLRGFWSAVLGIVLMPRSFFKWQFCSSKTWINNGKREKSEQKREKNTDWLMIQMYI